MTASRSASQKPSRSRQSSLQAEDKDSTVIRLRENQRRSRLRKKERLASLEAQLLEYKRAGTEATIEVQTAARHVVRENQRLRELLRVKGVPDSEVEAWVKDGQDKSGVAPVEVVFKALTRRPCRDGDLAPGATGRRKGSPSAAGNMPGGLNLRTQGTSSSERLSHEQQDQDRLRQDRSSPNLAASPTSSHCSFGSNHSPVSSQTESAPSTTMMYPAYAMPSPTLDHQQHQNHPPPLYSQPQYPQHPQLHEQQRLHEQAQDLYNFHLMQQVSQPDTSMFAEGSMSQQQQYLGASRSQGHSSSLPCDVARTMIVELQPGGSIEGLARELCPGGPSQGCVVDTGVLFGVMDKACM